MTTPTWTLRTSIRELPLAETFTIARETWDVARNVFVHVELDGHSGIGEVQPASRWGESPESVVSDLEALGPLPLRSPFDLETVSHLLPPGAARCALDIALHDLAAKKARLRLCEWLGLDGRELPPTSVTIPIADLDSMVARVESLRGHPVLKLKVGFDGDTEVVAAVREVFDGTLRVDANEGWHESQATDRLRELARFDIELCEQPIPAGAPTSLRRVREASPIPIFADEDVSTASDVAALLGTVDGVNLKLRKAGGIRETLRAVSVARAVGMRVMLGCDLVSGVAASAEAHIGSLFDHLDIDGPLLLADDPFPVVSYDTGHVTLPSGPGLGVKEDEW